MYQIDLGKDYHNFHKPTDELCIQIHQNWLGFAIFDREIDAFIAFHTEMNEPFGMEINEDILKNWLSKHQSILNLKFSTINIGINTNNFIILPKDSLEVEPAFAL